MQRNAHGVLDESGHARCLSGGHELPDLRKVFIVERNGDLGRGHTNYHTTGLLLSQPEDEKPGETFSMLAKDGVASSRYDGCESLAAAFERLDRLSDAVTTLETCVASKPPYSGGFSGAHWLKARLHLADEYRLVNPVADAIAIEQDLRKYLPYADADHPLVKRLTAR